MKNWILAARPKTLSAAFVPILIAWAVVTSGGASPKLWTFILALLASLFIQIGTNLVNDASDFNAGKDTPLRLGPTRVSSSGLISGKSVMVAAALAFFAAFLCGIPLVKEGGTPILILGLVSILCGYAYTAGPFPLAYNGLGEVFVILFFGIASVAGLCWINMKQVPPLALVTGLQAGLLCSVLLAINNLRDIAEDQVTGKNTLAARFGKNFARYEIAVLLLLPYLLGYFAMMTLGKGILPLALPFLALPLALKIYLFLAQNEASPIYNKYLGLSSLHYMLFGILLTLGILL